MSGRKRYPRQEWYDFGKQLLERRGSNEQREFLEACLSSDTFLAYMDEHLPLDNIEGDSALGSFDYQFQELEFIDPPLEPTQKYIWEVFRPTDSDGNEEIYADGCFWGIAVREMVQCGLVEAPSLAVNIGETHENAGITNIEDALNVEDESVAKAVDDCVRRILRSMCNAAPRGARAVFYDFPLGRSWWRWHWAERMAGLLALDRDYILERILTGANYGIIAEKMHSGRSYLSPDNVFGGLILFLRDRHGAPLPGRRLRKVIDELAAQSAWQAIELRPPADNQNEISKLHRALPSRE